MPLDDDPQDLKAAFAELHRRECADAPPFEAMRQRAMNAASASTAESRPAATRWLVWGAPTACAAALLLWWSGRMAAPTSAERPSTETAQHVEQLLDAIEQHIEMSDVVSFPTYATDALLTQMEIDR